MKNKTMNKIEKFNISETREWSDKEGNHHIERIDSNGLTKTIILNQSQKQLKNKKNVEWKDGDILTTMDKKGLVHYFVLNEMGKSKKQTSKLLKEK